jgi:hypothetical protein
MDISTLDTAVPLRPDKGFEFALYSGIGLDLASAVNLEEDIVYNDSEQEPGISVDAVSGYKMGIGINPELDFCGRFYVSSYSWGAKAGIKKLVWQEGKRYFSVMPSATYIREISDDVEEPEDEKDRNYNSYGFENQLLYTGRASKFFSYTLAMRGNYNRLQITPEAGDDGSYNVFHGGLRGNVRLSLGPFYIVPEAGYELVPIVNGRLDWMPTFCFAAGMNF